MTQHTPKLLTLLLTLLIAGGIIAAKAPEENKQYDYVTIEKAGYRIYISEGSDKFEEIKVKEIAKDFHHYGPLHKVINDYEAKGYEVYTNNVMGYASSESTSAANFVLLRKAK